MQLWQHLSQRQLPPWHRVLHQAPACLLAQPLQAAQQRLTHSLLAQHQLLLLAG
jgi:hypothetical protein